MSTRERETVVAAFLLWLAAACIVVSILGCGKDDTPAGPSGGNPCCTYLVVFDDFTSYCATRIEYGCLGGWAINECADDTVSWLHGEVVEVAEVVWP